jgi:imidazoleglycerol-phosphate dehydratase
MRNAYIERKTKETDIKLSLAIREDNEKGTFKGTSGVGFFDHMLNAFATHGGFDIELTCKGDLEVDCHHTIEDIGIVLGTAFKEAVGDMKGITRFADIMLPMDEALCMCAVDYSGRAYLVFDGEFTSPMIGDYDTQMTVEFLRAFAFNAGITLHAKVLYGDNDHHKVEAVYKAVAKCLKKALTVVSDSVPSSKGTL